MSWTKMKLGDAATFVNGYPFKPTDWQTEGMEIIRIQNLTGRGNDINYFDGEIPEKYKVKKGDLLISWSATLGIFEWDGEDAWLNQHIFKVVFNKIEFDKSFFKHLISTVLIEFGQKVHGSTMKHITKVNFDKTIIPLPPLPEQKRIAAILDKANALRQKNKQLLAAYDELLQATFLELFGDPVTNPKGWEKIELSLLAAKNNRYSLSSGPFGSSLTSKDYVDIGVPILRGTNITSGKLDMTNVKYITEEKAKELKRSEVKPLDIVMIAVGSSGKALMIPANQKRAIMSQNFNKITVDTNMVKPIFMEYTLNDSDIQLQIKRKMSDTVRTFFSLTNMKELKVICPPISLQGKFEQLVENIEAQKAILKQSIQESEDLFNGLVQKAFNGEL